MGVEGVGDGAGSVVCVGSGVGEVDVSGLGVGVGAVSCVPVDDSPSA